MSERVNVGTKGEDTFFRWGLDAKNSSGLTNVQPTSCCIILTERPLRIILIKDSLCKANPSLLWEKKNTTACWEIPQRGIVCGHVTSVATLKCTPLGSTSLEELLRGEDTSREIYLICTNGLFSVRVCVRSGVYIFPWLTQHGSVHGRLCACVSNSC